MSIAEEIDILISYKMGLLEEKEEIEKRLEEIEKELEIVKF